MGFSPKDIQERTVPYGPYKGYILKSLPDSVLEELWQQLDGEHAGFNMKEYPYSEEQRELLDLIVCETVER